LTTPRGFRATRARIAPHRSSARIPDLEAWLTNRLVALASFEVTAM